jgi:hypothetical protein
MSRAEILRHADEGRLSVLFLGDRLRRIQGEWAWRAKGADSHGSADDDRAHLPLRSEFWRALVCEGTWASLEMGYPCAVEVTMAEAIQRDGSLDVLDGIITAEGLESRLYSRVTWSKNRMCAGAQVYRGDLYFLDREIAALASGLASQ